MTSLDQRKGPYLQVTPAAQRRSALRATPATLPGVPGRPTFASASSCDTDRFLSADHLTEIGEAERTTAPITVAPIKANVRIIVSPKFATQEPTKIIATHCEVGLIQIKFYRPNWFMRRSFWALNRTRARPGLFGPGP